MENSQDPASSLNESSSDSTIDLDTDSHDYSPESNMILTQCVPETIKWYDTNKVHSENIPETADISKRTVGTQCDILKESLMKRDAEAQTDEDYYIHCSKKPAIYVETVSEQTDNVYVNIEIPDESNEVIKPKSTIRLGLSKKWKLAYKINK